MCAVVDSCLDLFFDPGSDLLTFGDSMALVTPLKDYVMVIVLCGPNLLIQNNSPHFIGQTPLRNTFPTLGFANIFTNHTEITVDNSGSLPINVDGTQIKQAKLIIDRGKNWVPIRFVVLTAARPLDGLSAQPALITKSAMLAPTNDTTLPFLQMRA